MEPSITSVESVDN